MRAPWGGGGLAPAVLSSDYRAVGMLTPTVLESWQGRTPWLIVMFHAPVRQPDTTSQTDCTTSCCLTLVRKAGLQLVLNSPLPAYAQFYNSNFAHHNEMQALIMRDSMEELLYAAGTDLVLSGHVHAYERMHPTCVQAHLTLDLKNWTLTRREALFEEE